MTERISIALAACNGERFLKEQLESLLRQTRVPDEIVISDDSQNGETRRVVEAFEGKTSVPIRYFHNDPPLGITRNFSGAAERCTGDVVFFCDQDDVWLPGKCETLLRLLQLHPEADGAFCDSMLTDASLKALGVTHRRMRGFTPAMEKALLAADALTRFEPLLVRIPAAGHNMAVRRRALEKLLPFPVGIGREYDTCLGYGVALLGGWAASGEVLTLFRQHENNATGIGKTSPLQAAKYALRNRTSAQLAAVLTEVLERLPEGDPQRRALLAQKRDHAAARAVIQKARFCDRLPQVWQEWCSGRYARFGRGWRNAVQDLLLSGRLRREETSR